MLTIFKSNKYTIRMVLLAIVLVLAVMPSFAQSISLDVETDEFISAINQWLPLAISIVVIGVGIRGGFALANYVGDMITSSFNMRGRS
ncbi:MAG: hypothetical protein AAF846_22240 [Chloroflexota bacterium]